MEDKLFNDLTSSIKEAGLIKDKPVFQHDCPNCQFLGHYQKRDLYFCKYNGGGNDPKVDHPTVLSRFGNEGYQYSSGLLFKYREGHLLEAIHRSIKRELMTQEFYDKAIANI